MPPADDATVPARDLDLVRYRELLQSGRTAEVVRRLESWTPRDREAHPESHVLLADAYLTAGSTDLAIATAREAVRTARGEGGAAVAAAGLAFALARQGDGPSLDEARRALDPSVAAMRGRLDDAAARVHHADGVLLLREGRIEEARLALLDALAAAAVCGDAGRCAMVHDTLGTVHTRLGDALRALGHYDESLRAKVALGDVAGQAITHGNRARLLLAEGRPAEALEEFEADVGLSRDAGDAYGLVVALGGRGVALTDLRRFDEAEAALRAALRLAGAGGHAKQEATCTKDLAVLAERRGQLGPAALLAEDAVRRFESMGNAEGAGFSRTVLGRILYRAGDAAASRAQFARAVELLRTTLRGDLLADALIRLAETSPEGPEAARVLDEAERVAREHFLREVVRDVQAVRTRLAEGPPATRLQGARNAVGFGRDRREYHLLERLGKGSQGEAWKSLDVATGRLVVVKRQTVERSTDDDRLRIDVALREFEAAMRLDHRGVVRVHEVERVGGELLLALDLLPGPDLRARLRRGSPQPAFAWAWIRDLASAVDALHAAGIVHRDLKPENIVFDADDRPVVIDFGLSLLARRRDPLAACVVGTPGYGAPEQWSRAEVGPRADVFALGVIAVELLAGANFLTGSTGARTSAEYFMLMQDASRVASLADGVAWPAHVGPAARASLRRMVDPDPERRPASAGGALAECALP